LKAAPAHTMLMVAKSIRTHPPWRRPSAISNIAQVHERQADRQEHQVGPPG
jgi:hypothetical protein